MLVSSEARAARSRIQRRRIVRRRQASHITVNLSKAALSGPSVCLRARAPCPLRVSYLGSDRAKRAAKLQALLRCRLWRSGAIGVRQKFRKIHSHGLVADRAAFLPRYRNRTINPKADRIESPHGGLNRDTVSACHLSSPPLTRAQRA